MAKLIYSAITSLDGCVADDDRSFDWEGSAPRVGRRQASAWRHTRGRIVRLTLHARLKPGVRAPRRPA